MAKETKFIEVSPASVEPTIEHWRTFGWELLGAPQEIFNKSSRLESDSSTIYNITETTHYVKITFQRDSLMTNYNELVSLEREYYSLPSIPNEPLKPEKYSFFSKLIIGVGIFYLGIPSILVISSRSKKYPLELQQYEEVTYPAWEAERDKILNRKMEIIAQARVFL